jgi:hypothetical protein
MARLGKIHLGRPITIKSRKELLETIKPHQREYLRADTGDGIQARRPSGPKFLGLVAHGSAAAVSSASTVLPGAGV